MTNEWINTSVSLKHHNYEMLLILPNTVLLLLQADVDNDIKLLTQKNEEITEVVSQLESNSSKLEIDEAVVTTTPLYNQ